MQPKFKESTQFAQDWIMWQKHNSKDIDSQISMSTIVPFLPMCKYIINQSIKKW